MLSSCSEIIPVMLVYRTVSTSSALVSQITSYWAFEEARRQEKCWLDLPAWWWQRSIVVRNSKSRRLFGDTAPKLAWCWIVRTITFKLRYLLSPSLKYFLSLWPPASSLFLLWIPLQNKIILYFQTLDSLITLRVFRPGEFRSEFRFRRLQRNYCEGRHLFKKTMKQTHFLG